MSYSTALFSVRCHQNGLSQRTIKTASLQEQQKRALSMLSGLNILSPYGLLYARFCGNGVENFLSHSFAQMREYSGFTA